MSVKLARDNVEATVKNETAKAQAARGDDGRNKGIISGFGASHETQVAFA